MTVANLELIKKLREEIGVGISNCKKALEESNNDYEKAIDILRQSGILNASKKTSRATSDGLVISKITNNSCAVIEVNSETDFVARNDKFQKLCSQIIDKVLELKTYDLEIIKHSTIDNQTINDLIASTIATIGENIVLSKIFYYSLSSNEIIANYIHSLIDNTQDMGKIATILIAELSNNDKNVQNKANQLLKQICMHITANKPIAIDINSVSIDVINREKEIYVEQIKSTGKPAEIANKIAIGKLNKFFEENVLLEQISVIDNKTKIKDIITDFCKENSTELKLKLFKRVQLGMKED